MLALLILVAGAIVVAGAVVTAGAVVPGAAGHRLQLLRAAAGHLVDDLGRIPATFAVGGALSAAVVAFCWPLGRVAASMQATDERVYSWVLRHQSHPITVLMKRATLMGNRFEVKIVMAVACLVFVLWLRQRAALPVLAILGSFVLEKYMQKGLALVIHRGHPPTTLGTYPSGGCARLIAIDGLILFLFLWFSRPSRRVVVTAWSVLAVLAWIEGFSRIYLGKHWASDVYGGWIFGALLLVALVSTATVLLNGRTRPVVPAQTRPESEPLRTTGLST